MSVRAAVFGIIALACVAGQLSAQGFAGLGRSAAEFSQPKRGYDFTFPNDHGAHPDFQIEWWYLTANLKDKTGRDIGLQWTLFRTAMAPEDQEGWGSPQLWMGHAAVTTPTAHFVAERLGRGGIGQAGVTSDPFEAWIDDWQLSGDSFDKMRMQASGPEFAYDVDLTANGPLIFHGENGYSQKSSNDRASYYYSQPFFSVNGTLTLPEGQVEITGTAWLDREWASQPLAASQVSWDWFSMAFENGARLMGFALHDTEGSDYTQATWIEPDGTTTAYPNGAFTATALDHTDVAGRSVPTTWRVQLPQKAVDVEATAVNGSAWMTTSIPYWEGPVLVSGSHAGRGYLEMTGY